MIAEGQRVRVYYNLHKKCLSVMDKKTRRVIDHVDSIQLENVKFIVSAAGLARLRRQQRKSVIAFVEGDIIKEYGERGNDKGWSRVYFNPYVVDQFMVGDEPIYEVDLVYIEDKNIYKKERETQCVS